jgi:hypothetical protein
VKDFLGPHNQAKEAGFLKSSILIERANEQQPRIFRGLWTKTSGSTTSPGQDGN